MNRRTLILTILLLILIMLIPNSIYAQTNLGENIGLNFNLDGDNPQATVNTVKLLIMITLLSLAPAFLILTTCFTRIIVVLSFIRSGLGTQQSPPNQLLIGLALFLTFFIMRPVYTEILDSAINPFLEDSIAYEEAFEIGSKPMKEFMLKQTREKDLALFLRAANEDNVEKPMDLKLTTIVPAFAISELRTAFSIGFIVFIPFLVIDMVVASILMSMGMFMLPPVMISLPFKILLFVLVDGWYLVIESLLKSFA